MKLSRRDFLRTSGVGMTAFMMPGLLARTASAQSTALPPITVFIFQRFGADGLNMVMPVGDPYYRGNDTTLGAAGLPGIPGFPNGWRPTVAQPRDPGDFDTIWFKNTQGPYDTGVPIGNMLDLSNEAFFKLHPQMTGVQSLYDAGDLAIVHAVGNTGSSSHFVAQDAMDRATPPTGAERTGWLSRLLAELAIQEGVADLGTFAGISLNVRPQSSLLGPHDSMSMGTIAEVSINDDSAGSDPLTGSRRANALAAMYAAFQGNTILQGTGAQAQDAATRMEEAALESIDDVTWSTESYGSQFTAQLQDAARLIRYEAKQLPADRLGLRAIAIHVDVHWDHHDYTMFYMNRSAKALSDGLKSFQDAIGAENPSSPGTSYGDSVVTVTATEFGRTLDENGAFGTDHADAGVIFVQGAPVTGAKVYCKSAQAPETTARAAATINGVGLPGVVDFDFAGNGISGPQTGGVWPGLAPASVRLRSKRYWVFPSTDYRDVFAEVANRHMGISFGGPLERITPPYSGTAVLDHYSANQASFLNFL